MSRGHSPVRLLVVVGLCILAAAAESGARENDQVVQSAMNRFASRVWIWHRAPVTDGLDLVVALDGGMAQPAEPHIDGSVWLNATVGLVLQERASPFRAFIVTRAQGQRDCSATLLRVTSTDVVFRCEEEGRPGPILKFVYDIRSKRLVGSFTYERYLMTGARIVGLPGRRRARIVGHSGNERVTLEFSGGETPTFRVVGREVVGERPYESEYRAVESRLRGQRQTYRLPVSTTRDYVKARLMGSPKNDASINDHIDEWIGPCQLVDGRLWFGRAFYQGESQTGVGGLGYFAPDEGRFTMFTGDAIADWSASALHVERDAAWVALELVGEAPRSDPGGIVRFDRRSATFERVTNGGGVGRQFIRVGDSLLLVTDTGVSVVRDGRATHFIVDRTTDGRLRVVDSMR